MSFIKKTETLRKKLFIQDLRESDDYLLHLPIGYEDTTKILPISHANPGQVVQIEGEVKGIAIRHNPRYQFSALISDKSGKMRLRWFAFSANQKRIRIGRKIRILGEVRIGFSCKEMVHPTIAVAGLPLAKVLTPIYPAIQGVSQNFLRATIQNSLKEVEIVDTVPISILDHYQLMKFDLAIKMIHFPPKGICKNSLLARKHPAWDRIKFDEFLAQQLSFEKLRLARYQKKAEPLIISKNSKSLFYDFQKLIPFQLTDSQRKVIREISIDLEKSYPMYRLLQGDVGSGKTVVATIAALQAISCNKQVAFMVPTEILAHQHFQNLVKWFHSLNIRLGLLSGSLTGKEKKLILKDISNGSIQFVIGTQALIQNGVKFLDLGLSIIDEQHRFGVNQRLALGVPKEVNWFAQDNESNSVPHQLVMSATPIPRTLAMTLFADMDISIINENIPRRKPIKTKLVSDLRRNELLSIVISTIKNGKQAYWVFPLVQESETLSLKAAIDFYREVSDQFPEICTALLHGKLPSKEKTEIMVAFQRGEINLLIATTVIEIGIDVPRASLMVIEHAERFGLAQLHQLRGRIGRGLGQSICILLYKEPLSLIAKERLKIMFETNDGFRISKKDLQNRGPGEFLGVRQSGMHNLRFCNIKEDFNLAKKAKEAALWIAREYPRMAQKHLLRWSKRS